MAVVGKAEVVLGANSGQLESALSRLTQKFSAFGEVATGFQRALGAKALDGFISVVGALPSALSEATARVVKMGGALTDLSVQTGISMKGLQELSYAGSLFGASQEKIVGAIGLMQRKMTDGSTASADAFNALGLKIDDLKNKRPEEAFQTIAAEITKLKSPTEQAGIAMQLFGRSGAQMLAFLTSDMQKASKAANDLGFVLTDNVLVAGDAIEDKVGTLTKTWEGLWNNFISGIVTSNAVHDALDGLIQIIGMLSAGARDNQSVMQSLVENGIKALLAAVSAGATILSGFLTVVSTGIEIVAGLGTAYLEVTAAAYNFAAAVAAAAGADQVSGVFKAQAASALEAKDALANMAGAYADGLSSAAQTAADVAVAFADLNATLRKGSGEFKMGATTGGEFGKVLGPLGSAAKEAKGGVKELSDEVKFLLDQSALATKALGESLLQTSQAMSITSEEGAAAIERAENELHGLYYVVDRGSGLWTRYGDVVDQELENAAARTDEVTEKQFDFSQALQDTTNIMNILGVSSESTFGKVVGGLQAGIAGAAKAAASFASGNMLGAISGALSGVMGLFGGLFGKKKKKEEKKPEKTMAEQFSEATKKAEELGSIGDAAVRKLLGTMKGTAEATKYMTEQLGKAQEGIGGLGGITLVSEEAARDQGTIFSAVFWASVGEQGMVKASDAMREPFNAMLESMKAAGMESADEIMAPIARVMALTAESTTFRGAAEGVEALKSSLSGLANTNYLTVESFSAIQRQAQVAFDQMIAGGATQKEAFQTVGPLLNDMLSASQNYGIQLDANTQSLIAQAKESGVAFKTEPMERVANAVEAIAIKLGALPPHFENIVKGTRQGQDGFEELSGVVKRSTEVWTEDLNTFTEDALIGGMKSALEHSEGAVDRISNRLDALNGKVVTTTVVVNEVEGDGDGLPGAPKGQKGPKGNPSYNAGGMDATLRSDAIFKAHRGERVSIMPGSASSPMAKDIAREVAGMVGGGGGGDARPTNVTIPVTIGGAQLGEIILQMSRDGAIRVYQGAVVGD